MVSAVLRGGIIGCAIAGLGAIPLHAEDDSSVYAALFQSLRLQERFEREVQTSPQVLPPQNLDLRLPRPPPQTLREKKREVDETAKPVVPPRRPPKPTEIPSNPHLALMTDPTLMPGDIVIFPDGPRVFQGTPGRRHARSDFVPFAKAKGLTKSDRRYLTALRTGVNDAWTDDISGDTKVARKARDVETTGSISRPRNRR
jgi:hypothetical protein